MGRRIGWIVMLVVALAAIIYLIQPDNPTGEWQKIDERASELFFATDREKSYWRTSWFREEQTHRVLGWRDDELHPSFVMYLHRRPYGRFYHSIPAPADLFGWHPLFDAGYTIGIEQLHQGRTLAHYVVARVQERECLMFVGAASSEVPEGKLENLNRYLSGYYCADAGFSLGGAAAGAILDAIGIKEAGNPIPG